MEILEWYNVFEYGSAFNLNSENCKKNNKIKKQVLNCLPNLREDSSIFLIDSSKY